MIALTLCTQSKGYCGPACLQMVLSAYGIRQSQDRLATLTKTTREKGCSEDKMVKVASTFGLKGFVKQHSSLREVTKLVNSGIPVIVNWFSPEEAGHYSVVVGFEKDALLLADPHFGKIIKHSITWFEERWFDVVGGKLILKEIIAIHR